MMHFLIISLAVLLVWETILLITPGPIPPWIQPPIVVGLAVLTQWVDGSILYWLAVGGAVLLMHQLIVADTPMVTHLTRTRRTPPP